MFKCLLSTIIIFIANGCFCQDIVLHQYDSIPINKGNKQFLSAINKQFAKAVKDKTDTVFLLYEADLPTNYAVLFWKRGGVTKSTAFYQPTPKAIIKKASLKNSTLNSINILSIYAILENPELSKLDTMNTVSHDFIIYGKFYYNKKKQVKAAYESKFLGALDKKNILFVNAFTYEKYIMMKAKRPG